MNKIHGVNVSGLNYNGRLTFSSFGGLVLWIDPRVNVTFQGNSNRLNTITDRSESELVFTEPKGSSDLPIETYTGDSQFISINHRGLAAMTQEFTPNVANLTCLVDGSPFTIYTVEELIGPGSGGVSNRTVWMGRISPQTRLYINLTCRDSTRRIQYQVFSGDGTTILASTSSPTCYEFKSGFQVFEINHSGYGLSGGTGNTAFQYYVNDVQFGGGDWTLPPESRPWDDQVRMLAGSGGNERRMFLYLVYDHTGKSEAVINQDRALIRNLITEIYHV